MVSRQSQSTFALVPDRWVDLVVGIWTVLLAGLGIKLTFAGARRVLRPPEPIAWTGVLVTLAVAAFSYGVFAFGVTAVYRRSRGFEPVLADGMRGRQGWSWVGGLGLVATGLIGATGLAAMLLDQSHGILAPMIAVGSPPTFISGPPSGMGTAGVNDLLNSAPRVLFVALLGGVFSGPALAVLVHGILQDVVSRAVSAESAIVVTAVSVAIFLQNGPFTAAMTPHEAVSAGIVVCFVGAVAYAYRETNRLAVAMAAYGVFNILAVILGWLSIVVSLYGSGHLFG